MRVALKQNWFGPDAVLYVRSIHGTIIPDDLRDVLPESAKVLDEDEALPAAPVEPVQTLASFDEERQAEEAVEAVIEKAEATRVAGGRKPPRHG